MNSTLEIRRKEHREYMREWRARQENKGKNSDWARRWRQANQDRIREYRTAWNEAHPGAMREYRRQHEERDPLQHKAHVLLYRALRRGQLVKPDRCSRCRARKPKGQIHGHHPNHSKPLDVVWLCFKCHRLEHVPSRKALGGDDAK